MDSISVDTNAVAPSAEEHFTMGSAPCASPDGDSPFKNEDGDDQTFVPVSLSDMLLLCIYLCNDQF